MGMGCCMTVGRGVQENVREQDTTRRNDGEGCLAAQTRPPCHESRRPASTCALVNECAARLNVRYSMR